MIFHKWSYWTLPNSTSISSTSSLKSLRYTYCKFPFFLFSRIQDVSIGVSDYLAAIILHLCQHCSTRLEWTLLVFRIVAIFRSPYFVLLGLSRGEHHLYLFIILVHLGLSGGCESLQNSVNPTSYSNRSFSSWDSIFTYSLIISRTKEVDLIFSYFLFLFLFSFQFIFLYSIFRTRVRVRVTRSRCHTAGHKSHNT